MHGNAINETDFSYILKSVSSIPHNYCITLLNHISNASISIKHHKTIPLFYFALIIKNTPLYIYYWITLLYDMCNTNAIVRIAELKTHRVEDNRKRIHLLLVSFTFRLNQG